MVTLKQCEKALASIRERWEKLTRGAKLAMDQQHVSLAREAIEAQIAAEADMIRCEASLELAQECLADARSCRQQAQQQLLLIRGKKEEILARARIARTREKIGEGVPGPVQMADSLLDILSAQEAKVEEQEASIGLRRTWAGSAKTCSTDSLDQRVKTLTLESEIDRRMAELTPQTSTRG